METRGKKSFVRLWGDFMKAPDEGAEKVAEDEENSPQALKAPKQFHRLSGPTEVGPFPKVA